MKKLVILLLISVFFCMSALAEDGFMVHQEIKITFPYGDRVGYYTGSTVDGVPDGYGTFELPETSKSVWLYVGEFSGGLPSGNGKTIWPENSEKEEGRYENGILQEGTNTVTKKTLTVEGTFGTGSRFTLDGKAYNGNGQLVFEGRIEDSLFQSGTMYNIDDGSVMATGEFGQGFAHFIKSHYINGYLY